MDHTEFLAFIKSILGKIPHMNSRQSLADLICTKGTSFRMLDEWVPKGTYGLNPNNPLKKIDGVKLEVEFVTMEGMTFYVPQKQDACP
jgi:hypothetical protein